MNSFRKTASELLGFDRRERRGTYILALMLLLLLLVRVFTLRPGNEPVNSIMLASGSISVPETDSIGNTMEPSTFDPNTASFDDLLRLGLSERQASTLINYRSSGARFRKPGDIARVYGIDSATAARLLPWIMIAEAEAEAAAETKTVAEVDAEAPPAPPKEQILMTKEVKAPGILIDVNLCSADDLIQLPGIGPVLSQRIIKYRRLLGGYVSTGQLREVYGLDSSVFENIEERLTLSFDSVTPLLLDSSSFSELARHPYLGSEAAGLIIKYRSLMGRSVTLGELVSQHALNPQQASRIAPYVRPSPMLTGDDYEFISSKVLK